MWVSPHIQNLPKTEVSIKQDYAAVFIKITITDPFITTFVYHLSS